MTKVGELVFFKRKNVCSKALEALQISEAMQAQLKDMGNEDSSIPVSAVNHKRITNYKKTVPAKTHRHPSTCKCCGGKHEAARVKYQDMSSM